MRRFGGAVQGPAHGLPGFRRRRARPEPPIRRPEASGADAMAEGFLYQPEVPTLSIDTRIQSTGKPQ